MKVLMINGSTNATGCTYTALNEIAKELTAQGIATEIVQVGKEAIHGCTGCGACRKLGKCMYDNDAVNAVAEKAAEADAFVFGSPVHYAAASGAVTSFLDRLFYSAGAKFAFKPGAVVASARRAGTTAAIDQLMKYLTINNMPVVSSHYWPMVHGSNAEQVRQDEEGMQVMRQIGRNMAWLLKSIEAGRENGIAMPEREERIYTNFIR